MTTSRRAATSARTPAAAKVGSRQRPDETALVGGSRTTFVFSAVYYAATGSYFFSDSHVPIAVFLGMHLLFTDPATSPRTELGASCTACSMG